MIGPRLALLLALAPFVVAPSLAVPQTVPQTVPEPTDYRMDAFRAPVPATLQGATVIGTEGAFALWRAGVAFIDVMPKNEKPANLPKDTLWIDPKRVSIPGAFWVPNVGYGRIHETRDAYFRAALGRAVGGERDAPMVIFCQEDCWMSWNAARRAILDYGYTRVFWYPEGSDGWKAGGHPVEQIPTFVAN